MWRILSRFPAAVPGILAVAWLAGGCAATGVSRADEIRIGQEAAAEIESQYRTREDAALTSLGQQLAAVSTRPDYPYRFRVIEMEQVNAFALPGGPVYITSGMIEFTRGRPGELAAVVGHEIAHISHRHTVQQIQRQAWVGIGIDIFTRGTTRDVAVIAANLEQLGYSREQEREADTYGAAYLARAGLEPMAMVAMFQRLTEAQGNGGPQFLRTHPMGAERVQRLREQIESGEIARLAASR